MKEKHRIIFMGTPAFAVPALACLIENELKPVAVYTQPPRPSGRGKKVKQSPVHDVAAAHGIPVHTPERLKNNQDEIDIFASYQADIAIVAAYGLLLPPSILNAPALGCINIHASLLPRWRGASPIQHAVWKGDSQTGVTLMQMDEGLDTGGMIAKAVLPITHTTTAASLHDDLSRLGGDMLLPTLTKLLSQGVVNAEAQDDTLSNYAPMLSKTDGLIAWNDTAAMIDRQIRGLTPWPGTWCHYQGQRLKIHAASPVEGRHNQPVGTVLNKHGHMACGDGSLLAIHTLQPEGKSRMGFADALNGHYIAVGDQLG